jgi:short-subunit dehydrogenase
MNDTNLRPDPSLALPAVVITGGTEGIGRALAEEFARDGHNLVLVARDKAKLDRTAAELSSAYAVEVKVTAQDLTTVEGCAGVEQAVRQFGFYADVLVNNAGVMASGFFQDADPAAMRRMIDLDVRAVVDLTSRFLPGMLARGHGGVLNVASMMGFMPVPYEGVYAASKAFVLSFSKALAYETMGTGVTISVVAPGVVATALHAKA